MFLDFSLLVIGLIRAVFFMLCSIVAGCSSVPFSSMVKMATLDQQDIVNIAPNEVKVRLSITEPVELQTKNVRLVLSLDYKNNETREYKYLLELIDSHSINENSDWFSSSVIKHQYQFQLAKLSQLDFNKLQKNYVEHGKPQKYRWTVYYYLKTPPQKNQEISLDMELKLSAADDYFYLLKDASIDVD